MIRRVFGTETEFGIVIRSSDPPDPVSGSLFLISNYSGLPSTNVLWDYEQENPLLDARGFEVDGERERPGPEYNRMLNKVLANGGRLYVDGAHPEYSTPECTNARDVVVYERVGDRILEQCCLRASRIKGGEKFIVYRNNSDGKGNSYGYHENYLVDRAVPFDRLMKHLTPFFVTRQIYAGSGKVGAENRMPQISYQISQRADFFETLVDLNTMVKRPIINTRDEPHSDPVRYRRFHVIVGDANMAEISTYLKVGVTDIVLAMIEEGWPLPDIEQNRTPAGAVDLLGKFLQAGPSEIGPRIGRWCLFRLSNFMIRYKTFDMLAFFQGPVKSFIHSNIVVLEVHHRHSGIFPSTALFIHVRLYEFELDHPINLAGKLHGVGFKPIQD